MKIAAMHKYRLRLLYTLEISCEYPPSVRNAHVIGLTGYKVTDIVQYSCKDGFVPAGLSVALCQVNGVWSENFSCIRPGGYINVSKIRQ